MIEVLEAEAALRDRYQFWTFGYSTGDPLPYTAALPRRDLDEVGGSSTTIAPMRPGTGWSSLTTAWAAC